MNYETFGPTPAGEPCQQVGMPTYDHQRAMQECRAFRKQLIRQFGEPPFGAMLKVKSFPHDFGSYMEVCGVFDENEEEAVEYVYNIEAHLPENWDAEAKKELGL